MNVDNLNKILKCKDTALYQAFKSFIDAAGHDSEYKLFHLYVFRVDCLERIIKNRQYPFIHDEDYLVNGEINYSNEAVKKYLVENSSLFIGNVFTMNHGFKPIFLSCNWSDEGILSISGFSVDIGGDVYFDKKLMKHLHALSREKMMHINFVTADLKNHIDTMLEKTKETLAK